MVKRLVRLEVVADEDSYDAVTGILTLMVTSGWQEESLPSGETRFLVYCEKAGVIKEVRQSLDARLPDASIKVDIVEEEDWLEAWKDFFTPVLCGDRFVVLPPWHAGNACFEDRTKIVIEPKSAFGTGHHATTVLCLQVLSEMLDTGQIREGQTFLDLGTGSGVLSIGLCKSGMFGCGIDIDPIAIDNAVENRLLNGVSENIYEIRHCSIEKMEAKKYDCVIANILATTLIEFVHNICKLCIKDGILILSGVLNIQADNVESVYMHVGLPKAQRRILGDWTVLYWNKMNI